MKKLMLNETSYHGSGAISAIVQEIRNRGFKKAFVVSDPDLVRFSITKKVTDLLEKDGIAYSLYTDIKENPTIENVKHGIEEFKREEADCIVAVGGGSPIDASKAIGIVITNPEFSDIRSLEGIADTKNPCVPIIAVPTTAGTAAEVTVNYVITDTERKRKFVCGDAHVIPIVAVVDPDMTASMPSGLTAATGMDALTHAIEGYITKGSWEISDMFHIKAIEIISRSLRDAVANKADGRKDMALGQYLAGMGFSNAGLGIDHSMAHTISAYYGTPHGKACAILLPAVMAYNAGNTGTKYRDIAIAMGVKNAQSMSQSEYRKAAIDAVKQLSRDIGIPATLKGIVNPEDIDALTQSAYEDACRPGNPREVTPEDIKNMFLSLM